MYESVKQFIWLQIFEDCLPQILLCPFFEPFVSTVTSCVGIIPKKNICDYFYLVLIKSVNLVNKAG